jgi:hypothetical protein
MQNSTDYSLESTLPASVDAERSILGAILLDNAAYAQASNLRPDDFSLDAHRRIYSRMVELAKTSRPIDTVTLTEELARRREVEAIGGIAYLAGLTDGLPRRPNIGHYVKIVRDKWALRQLIHACNSAINRAAEQTDPAEDILADAANHVSEAYRDSDLGSRIANLEDIPDIMVLDIPPIDYLVDGMISRKSMTLWSGIDGTAKTLLALKMGIAVALGTKFLDRRCHKAPVLYLDYENPDFAVRQRLDIMAGGPIPGFTVWGTWVDPQPPQIGEPVLLDIAKKHQPLMVVDPFRYAHTAEENDSTEMMGIMRHLRSYASAGAAVVVLHHPARAEGSTGRGSTAIRGAVDVAYLQEMNEDGLITLRCVKNRFGEKWAVTLQPDYGQGSFDITDSPEFTKRADEVEKVRRAIADKPGMSQNQVHQATRINKNKLVELLKAHDGVLWQAQKNGQAWAYFPPVS